MVHPYNRVLLSNKGTFWYIQQHGWISLTLCFRKRPGTKSYRVHDSIHMIFWKRQKFRIRNQITAGQGLEVRRDFLQRGQWGTFWVIEVVVIVTWLYIFVKSYQTVYFKRVKFTICKLCPPQHELKKRHARESTKPVVSLIK